MQKKIFLFAAIVAALLAVSGCAAKKAPIMDQPADDGAYHYRNQDLGFAIIFPPEFEYYQTQRSETGAYVEIAFFVPTGDAAYAMEVPGYAKPVTVRIFSRRAWESDDAGSMDAVYRTGFSQIAESGDEIYTIKFWDGIPSDWQSKWSDEMADKIKDSFNTDK
jgi:hypothetical protein